MISSNEFRNGVTVEMDGDAGQVVEQQVELAVGRDGAEKRVAEFPVHDSQFPVWLCRCPTDLLPHRPHGVSLSWMCRYSICPRSPSSPMGPVGGSTSAASSTSPLQVQCATLSFTVTTISFQSCGL